MKKRIIALAMALVMAVTLAACASASLKVDSDDSGIHAVATGGASGSANGSITIEEHYGLCVNHIVSKGSFHIKATNESGAVVFEKDITDNVADLVPVQGEIEVEIEAKDAEGTIDVIAYDISAQAEADSKLDDALEQEGVNREEVGLANPWSSAATAESAAEGAGVGYFEVPEAGTKLDGGTVAWSGYQYMKNLAEADGAIEASELTVRKGLKQDSEDVSGDYNEYAHTWDITVGDWQVHCFGNDEGKAQKVTWVSDNFSYSIGVRAQDEESAEVVTLSEADVTALVGAIQ